MKKTIKLAVVAALALGTTSVFATNGTNLIGYGAKSRAMGGTAISNFNGAESAFANPALISVGTNKTDATIGATILMPDVTFESDANANGNMTRANNGATSDNSTAGNGMIPSVAVINKIDNTFAWGLALYGVGGMGVDYREASDTTAVGLNNINDNLMLMRMSIPLAYTISGFSIGVAPVIEYGSLAMNNGVTTDIATGYEIGAAYSISDFSFGLDYKSAVTHNFKNTFNSTISAVSGQLDATNIQSKLDTPSVLGLGISYKIGASTIAIDYKKIAYGSAKGFEDFGWEDQSVYAIGYEFTTKSWALRAGYNHASSPLPTDITGTNVGNMTSFGQVTGSFMQFPAVTESHITFGGSYNFSKVLSVDLAYMIASGSATASTPDFSANQGFPSGEITTTNNQTAASFALNYAY